jgi:PAS domain-containing protein
MASQTGAEFARLLDALPHGALITRPDGVILVANHEVASLLDARPADLVGTPSAT